MVFITAYCRCIVILVCQRHIGRDATGGHTTTDGSTSLIIANDAANIGTSNSSQIIATRDSAFVTTNDTTTLCIIMESTDGCCIAAVLDGSLIVAGYGSHVTGILAVAIAVDVVTTCYHDVLDHTTGANIAEKTGIECFTTLEINTDARYGMSVAVECSLKGCAKRPNGCPVFSATESQCDIRRERNNVTRMAAASQCRQFCLRSDINVVSLHCHGQQTGYAK